MIINDSIRLDERATFMDKLKSSKVGDSFNIFSGSRNFVVTQVASDRFKVVPGKGYDKGMTAYINKCYLNPKEDQIVTRNALQNFIRTINSNNGWREDLDLDSTEDELTESVTDSQVKSLKVGDKIIHTDFDSPVEVIGIRKESNPIYNTPYGFSVVEVRADDGNQYDLYINSETLRRQKKIGNQVKKWTKIIKK